MSQYSVFIHRQWSHVTRHCHWIVPVRGLASADLQPYSGLVLRCCAFAPHPLHIASNPSSQRHSITVDIVVDVVLSSHAARSDVAAAAAAAAVCACVKPTQSGQRDDPLTSSKCTIIHCDTVVVHAPLTCLCDLCFALSGRTLLQLHSNPAPHF